MKKYFIKNRKFGIIGVFVLGGFFLAVFLVVDFRVTKADLDSGTNIHPTTLFPTSDYHWAWNDEIGWIDFHSTHNVNVHSRFLEGWASSSVGEIVLNCHTQPGVPSDNCNDPDVMEWGVENDGSGYLSGLAWNDTIGWISFCGRGSSIDCVLHDYQVMLGQSSNNGEDAPPSYFRSYAWNDIVGWIAFDCRDYYGEGSGCSTYKVGTDWFSTSTYGILNSAIIDTGEIKGVQINSIIWKGSLPIGTAVSFQLAAATSTDGLLVSPTFLGPGGLATAFYNTIYPPSVLDSPGVYRVNIDNISDFTDKRYFRYRVRLKSNQTQTLTPRIDEVTVSWSP